MLNKACIFILVLVCQSVSGQSRLSFYKDVQPIIHTNCVPCHRQGEAAPFPLITFDDVNKRSKFIKKVIQSRYMPPWKADNHYVSFANDRSLSEKDINTITKWIDEGSLKGPVDYKAEREIQKRANAGTSYKREPDLSLRMTSNYTVRGDGVERFVMFKIPFDLEKDQNVEAIEFTSNDKKLIHHANFAIHPVEDRSIDLDDTIEMVDLNGPESDKYYQWIKYKKSITYYGGWIPGTTVETYPQDMGWVMPKRGVILLTVHFGPSSLDAESFNGVNLFFKTTPIKRKVKVISLGSGGIGEKDISPPLMIFADEIKSFRLRIANNQPDVSLLYAWPHMHQLGKEFTAYATTPNADTIKIVHVPEWDFRWQEIYKYKKPLLLPKGAVITIEGTYDNTAANPQNPHNPPELVLSSGNMRSDQEMMTLLLMYVEREPEDSSLVFKWK